MSGVVDRTCAWCGAELAEVRSIQKFCGGKCRERSKSFDDAIRLGHWPREKFGPKHKAFCAECGNTFEKQDQRVIYCGNSCAQKAYRKSPAGLAYYARTEIKSRIKEASRRHAATANGRAAQKQRDAKPNNVDRRKAYAQSDLGRSKKAENQRLKAAARALCTLLMPTHQHPAE
jgi:hypothetical protein